MEENRLTQAVEDGDEYDILLATRRIVATQLENTGSGRDVAALSKQMQELSSRIAALEKQRSRGGKKNSIERARAAARARR